MSGNKGSGRSKGGMLLFGATIASYIIGKTQGGDPMNILKPAEYWENEQGNSLNPNNTTPEIKFNSTTPISGKK